MADDDVIERQVPDGGWGWMVVVGAMAIHFIHTGNNINHIYLIFYLII